MECPVCYEECSCLKLVCGHSICRGCVKEWTLKGCNDGCPMCRKPLYYRGFQKHRAQWQEERLETQYSEKLDSIFGELIDGFYEDFDDLDEGEQMPHWILNEDMKEIEQTFNILKCQGYPPEEIEYLILEEGLYLSERGPKWEWDDEPVKDSWVEWRPSHYCFV
jgi:hypothetical protein